MSEAQDTYDAIVSILKEEDTFDAVIGAVFASIDKDGSGTLEMDEIEEFVGGVIKGMNIKETPDKEKIKEIFEKMDEDKSKTISKQELGKYLRAQFEEQKNELEKQIKK